MSSAASVRSVPVVRHGAMGERSLTDTVVREEPLEIRLDGETLAITMRTPGADRELVLGFLWAEGVITSLADVAAVAHCANDENCIEVTPSDRMRRTASANIGLRRGTMTTSACGVCGRRTIDDLLARCTPLTSVTTMSAAALTRGTRQLLQAQPIFALSGGCHGAALVDTAGTVIAAREDVGRHNAVDKLVGALLLAGRLPAGVLPADVLPAGVLSAGVLPAGVLSADSRTGERAGAAAPIPGALIVSGRTSFEIVQKAVAAGIAIVAGISAASTLAIDTAELAGVTLAGFVRNDELVVYTHAERIVPGASPVG